MLSTIGIKHSTPVIGPVRLRGGKAADVRGAASFVAEAIATARQAGANPAPLVEAETCHRQHAIIEPQIADLKDSALAHLPSASFQANNAWLTLAAIAHNLTRVARCAASPFHARAETATIRAHLVAVPARIARSARQVVMHLPLNWPWHTAWQHLFATAHGPAPTGHLTDPTLTTSPTLPVG